MSLNISLPLIGEIAIGKASRMSKKYLTELFGNLSLHETSVARFPSDFLVMGFSFCRKTLLLLLPCLRTDPAGAG